MARDWNVFNTLSSYLALMSVFFISVIERENATEMITYIVITPTICGSVSFFVRFLFARFLFLFTIVFIFPATAINRIDSFCGLRSLWDGLNTLIRIC